MDNCIYQVTNHQLPYRQGSICGKGDGLLLVGTACDIGGLWENKQQKKGACSIQYGNAVWGLVERKEKYERDMTTESGRNDLWVMVLQVLAYLLSWEEIRDGEMENWEWSTT